jgi:hypothetical protein
MVHVTLLGRIFEVDLRSPHSPPRYWNDGRWMRDRSLSNEDVLFDPAALALPRRVVRTLPIAGLGSALRRTRLAVSSKLL